MPGVLIASTAAAPLSHENFYVVAATIIPVLFIALIYQANVVDAYRRVNALFLLTFGSILVLDAFWGEAGALHTLSSGHASSHARTAVGTALVFLGGTLAASGLAEMARHVSAARPNDTGGVLLAYLILFGAGTYGALVATGVL
jgi:hypothetical protein